MHENGLCALKKFHWLLWLVRPLNSRKKIAIPSCRCGKEVVAIGRAAKGEEEIGFVDGEWCGKVGIGFYMCLCGWWRQVVIGIRARANSMIMAD